MSKPYDLQTLYSQVYEKERRKPYGRMTRDLREAKAWLELYPDFWTDETSAETFQMAAQNFIRKGSEFARLKEYPMWLLLMQYNEYLPVPKEKQRTVTEWETCPDCLREKLPGQPCHHCKQEAV